MTNYWVDYKGGLINHPKKANGILKIQEQQLEFKSKKTNFTIPIKSVTDVRIHDENDTRDIIAGTLTLGIIGAIAGSKTKTPILTITYQGAASTPEYPEFTFVPIIRNNIPVNADKLAIEAANQINEQRIGENNGQKP